MIKFTQEELVDLVLNGNVKKEESFLGGRVRVTMIFPSEAERMELRSSIFKEKGQNRIRIYTKNRFLQESWSKDRERFH